MTDAGMEELKKTGLRATAPRVLIFNILKKARYPLSAQDVKKHAGATPIDTVTIYRTLEAFKRAGLAVQVDFQLGRALYELTGGTRDHHHVVCVSCNRIEDFTGCDYQPLAKQALRQASGFSRIISHSLEFFGLCALCAAK